MGIIITDISDDYPEKQLKTLKQEIIQRNKIPKRVASSSKDYLQVKCGEEDSINCGSLNHEAKECKESIACLPCSGNHKTSTCRSADIICINSRHAYKDLYLNLDVEHAVMDRHYRCYERNANSIKY